MGAGLPVISTRTGAIPELLGGGAGLLVDPGDPVGLADALERLARDPALRERLAEKGHRRILNDFNIALVASALEQQFESCAAGSGDVDGESPVRHPVLPPETFAGANRVGSMVDALARSTTSWS